MCDKSIEYFSNEQEIISRHIERENNIDLRRVLVVLIKRMSEYDSTYVANHGQPVRVYSDKSKCRSLSLPTSFKLINDKRTHTVVCPN